MPTSPTQRSFPLVLLALLSLATFAVAQSVYQAIAGNAEFVALNQVTHADLWLIIVCFNVLPAVVLALMWLGVRVFAPRLADRLLSAAFLLLLVPLLLELHKRYVSPLLQFHHNTVLVVIPLTVAAWIVFRYRAEFERFLLVLSPIVLIFPGLFLWHAWREVLPTAAPAANAPANFVRADTGTLCPPVFVLILDEFTRSAILDSTGNIHASALPALRRAGTGTARG